jgi:hypothetical protein
VLSVMQACGYASDEFGEVSGSLPELFG